MNLQTILHIFLVILQSTVCISYIKSKSVATVLKINLQRR
nr:MAG TPA: hypothetical protein [Caudoviricetes sp.]